MAGRPAGRRHKWAPGDFSSVGPEGSRILGGRGELPSASHGALDASGPRFLSNPGRVNIRAVLRGETVTRAFLGAWLGAVPRLNPVRTGTSPSASAGGAAPPLAEFLEWTFPDGRPHLAALRRLSASSHSPRSARRVLSERATHASRLRKTSASRGSPSRSLLSETDSHALRSPRTSLRSHRERVHQCARWGGTPSHARRRWPASDVRVPRVGTEEVAV